jgi:triacylglycerol lipase
MNSTISRNPVVLVHGIDDTHAKLCTLKVYLQELGWTVFGELDLKPNDGSVGLDLLAQQLAVYVHTSVPGDRPIDLVGYSMGGLISRYYLQRLGGIDRVQRFVTLSSPHKGTVMAYWRQNRGVSQMRPNSKFLLDLNRDVAMLKQINFTSIWTPLDLIIVPAESSSLAIGREEIIPIPYHPWMVSDHRSLHRVAVALSEPLRPVPVR